MRFALRAQEPYPHARPPMLIIARGDPGTQPKDG